MQWLLSTTIAWSQVFQQGESNNALKQYFVSLISQSTYNHVEISLSFSHPKGALDAAVLSDNVVAFFGGYLSRVYALQVSACDNRQVLRNCKNNKIRSCYVTDD